MATVTYKPKKVTSGDLWYEHNVKPKSFGMHILGPHAVKRIKKLVVRYIPSRKRMVRYPDKKPVAE